MIRLLAFMVGWLATGLVMAMMAIRVRGEFKGKDVSFYVSMALCGPLAFITLLTAFGQAYEKTTLWKKKG